MDGPRLTVSLLCLNRLDLTRRCVGSIFQNTRSPFELRIWDNGSTDGTAEYLEGLSRSFPGSIIVTRVEKNEGFIRPHNAQAEAARGAYVCVLNNDTEVGPGWDDMLIRPFDGDLMLAATGPRDDYGFISGDFIGIRGDGNRQPEYLSGHCLMVSKRVLGLGHRLFDDSVLRWAICEDADFSLRIRQAGFKTLVVPEVRVSHVKRATMDHTPEDVLGYDPVKNELRNRAAMQVRWGDWLKRRAFRRLVIVVKRRGAFGDVLCVEPILRGLKAKYPNSDITFVGARPWSDVLIGCPALSVLTRDGGAMGGSSNFLALDLDNAYESQPHLGIVEAYARAAGVPVDRPKWRLKTGDILSARGLVGGGPFALIATEVPWGIRQWPRDRFADIARRLDAAGLHVVEVGTERGKPLGVGTDLRGRTTINQLAAVFSLAKLAVMTDGFQVHFSACFQVPTVGVWGGTDPALRVHGPEHVAVTRGGFRCLACHHDRSSPRSISVCDNGEFRGLDVPLNACMDIPVEAVWKAVEGIL